MTLYHDDDHEPSGLAMISFAVFSVSNLVCQARIRSQKIVEQMNWDIDFWHAKSAAGSQSCRPSKHNTMHR